MEKKTVTKSGIEIYEYKNTSLHSFYISLFLRAGSMYEAENERGITHFLEHISIRNVNNLMSGKLYSELDRRGVDFNAATYAEMVQFYVSGASDKFRFATDVITKLFSPIVLTKDDIEAERKRIKAEIREGDDKTSLLTFSNGIVNEGTTLARLITGSATDVNGVTAKRLEEYRKKVFRSDNIFFYITGNYDSCDLDYLVSALDAIQLDIMEEKRDNLAPVSRNYFKRESKIAVKNADFTMLRFSFDLDMNKVTVPETDLLYDMLFSGYNSRFFIEMSERQGLFYDVSGAVERYRNIGELYFSFEVRKKDIYRAFDTALEILRSYKTELARPDDLMKSSYVDNAYLLYDDARDLNFTMAYDNHIMKLSYASLNERIEAYKKVTPERIRDVACEIFKPQNLTVTVKGNKRGIDTSRLEASLEKL